MTTRSLARHSFISLGISHEGESLDLLRVLGGNQQKINTQRQSARAAWEEVH